MPDSRARRRAGQLESDVLTALHGQVVVGMLTAGAAAYLSVRYLVRWFETRTLTPFAIYCLVAGVACTVRFAL